MKNLKLEKIRKKLDKLDDKFLFLIKRRIKFEEIIVNFQPSQLKLPKTIKTQLVHEINGRITNSDSLKISDKMMSMKMTIPIP